MSQSLKLVCLLVCVHTGLHSVAQVRLKLPFALPLAGVTGVGHHTGLQERFLTTWNLLGSWETPKRVTLTTLGGQSLWRLLHSSAWGPAVEASHSSVPHRHLVT